MKKTLLILTLLIFSSVSAHAQLDLSLNLLDVGKKYNPIPLRDDIPNVLVQAKPANTIIFPVKPKPPVAVTETQRKATAAEPIIVKPILAANLKIEPVKTETQAPTPAGSAQSKQPQEVRIKISLNELQKLPLITDKKITVLGSPKIIVLPQLKTESYVKAQKIYEPNQLIVPKITALEKVADPKLQAENVSVIKPIEISPDEYKLIQALLLYEYQKKYDSAMSLFVDLMNSVQFKWQALYHYAEISFILNLPNEFKTKMMQLTQQKSSPFFRKIATESLIKNASALAPRDIEKTEPLISEYGLSFNSSDYYLLRRAQYFSDTGDLNRAESSLKQVHPNSKIYNSAQLLLSNIYYRQGQLNSALKVLENQQERVSNLAKTDKIRNLTFLNLARMYFQKGQYKNSYAQYLKVDKSSSHWLQASQEQALTQILFGDYIGAAGNMFSLHTDYFKKAYAPESYIVRAIGYLNLCQFGDAVSVVADLHRRYSKQYEQILSFKNAQHATSEYYNLVHELFKAQQAGDVKNLPRAFVIELARHPGFIAVQKQINASEEEIAGFNQIINGLSSKAAKLRTDKEQSVKQLAQQRQNKQNPLLAEQLERQILAYESEIAVLAKGREKIERMRNSAQERMSQEKSKFKIAAAEILKKQYQAQFKVLTEIMEQKDVLAYDIYSGAGEHLRYQMAGGEMPSREPAETLTPDEKKSYRWKFRGEVWEDEVGHYRSSLTNVCAKEGIAHNTGGE